MNASDIDGRLREVIVTAYKNSPATQERFDAAELKPDDVQTVADLAQVSVLPKDDIVGLQQTNPPFGGLLAVPMKNSCCGLSRFTSHTPLRDGSWSKAVKTSHSSSGLHFTGGGVRSVPSAWYG